MFRVMLLAVLLLPLSGVAQTSVYRTTDENGRVVFTDTPPANGAAAESVKVPQTNITAPPQDLYQRAPASRDSESAAATPAKVTITQPANEATIGPGPGNFDVAATTAPPLKDKQTLQLLVDGTPFGAAQATANWLLTNINRGAHDLTVQVIGEAGQTLATSDPIRVYVLRPSAATSSTGAPGAEAPNANGQWGQPDANGQWSGRPRFR